MRSCPPVPHRPLWPTPAHALAVDCHDRIERDFMQEAGKPVNLSKGARGPFLPLPVDGRWTDVEGGGGAPYIAVACRKRRRDDQLFLDAEGQDGSDGHCGGLGAWGGGAQEDRRRGGGGEVRGEDGGVGPAALGGGDGPPGRGFALAETAPPREAWGGAP